MPCSQCGRLDWEKQGGQVCEAWKPNADSLARTISRVDINPLLYPAVQPACQQLIFSEPNCENPKIAERKKNKIVSRTKEHSRCWHGETGTANTKGRDLKYRSTMRGP